jgi:acyl-CoA reductase-like NAD-dependent aldehyde dehydrogenase
VVGVISPWNWPYTGVFNLVTGPGPVVGDEVASNPGTRAVGFIGSIATGHRVAERAAGNELLLEMGGNGPLVVLEDANLDRAVAATLTACFLNAGQSCTAGERILVHRAGGASGSRSGVGRVVGRFSMDRLTELKTIVIDVS